MDRLKIFLLSFLCILLFGIYSFNAGAKNQPDRRKNLAGTWQGTLKVSGIELRVIFRIEVNESDSLVATMESPDQSAAKIPVSAVVLKDDTLDIDVKSVLGRYKGVCKDDSTIQGTWYQSGYEIPLELHRALKEPRIVRPQEPGKPYPYIEEEVEYRNEKAGIKLAGTLTIPNGGSPFPAVILISGSGPQDRNEYIMGHKPFLVLADYLTRRGIAVLRVDDRGVGSSAGDFSKATSEDFAEDVMAGIRFLKSRNEIDKKKIGLVGHSEGGLIAPMVAAGSGDVAFIVLMAGPGLRGDKLLEIQSERILRASGVGDELIGRDRIASRRIFSILRTVEDDSLAKRKITGIMKEELESLNEEEKKALGADMKNLEAQVEMLLTPWFRFFIAYDPGPSLKKVKCPVLALNGEKDLQVPPKENLSAIEEALREGGNKNFLVKELPRLNHLFQTADSGLPSEYGKIEETISPRALEIIGDWIDEVTGD